ncbi:MULTISPECIES: sugar-binding transcriptional regulator [unclassified Sedimentibacter]|uniref:sugar-binding transcriptional regulator n=1 Tax=unclassified Sedimentibacter TaxID=2649220 RepID=UPI0027DFA688|nr:sugar-binding domain-containing protein [Sedimentibacter sp. MB35-C1]WMJ76373.1 sugar-binding domain-containing protein [Sedimentibacter sp. MB35-C1]
MDINKILEIQNRIVPETFDLLMKRYEILKIISTFQPIGRRNLSAKLGISERIMRAEIDKLKEMDLLDIQAAGVSLTGMGLSLLSDIHNTFYYIKNLSEIELKLMEKLRLKRVAVVSGDADKDSFTFIDLGKKAAEIVKDLIRNDTVLGISGGTTMACVVNQMKRKKGIRNLLVLPARGGLSEELEIQANTIAANLAEKLDASYKLLHIPDNLDETELGILKNNKLINDVLEDIQRIDLLVFGLGNARDMAIRRKSDKRVFNIIESERLTAEAFGYFFDKDGNVKMHTNSVGITMDNFRSIKNAVGVAGGSSKAEAIYSISKFNNNFILITDEAAAKRILEL